MMQMDLNLPIPKNDNGKHKKPPMTKGAPSGNFTVDAFQNVLARLGFGTPNMMEGTAYPLTRLSRDYVLMNSLYRSHWIVRKIIDTIPEDACKNWVSLMGEVTPEEINEFQKVERKTKTKAGILRAWKWGRLYGGAAAVIMIDGHENKLNEPLNPDEIIPDSYKGLLVLDRWSGISPSLEKIDDVNDPDFGLPQIYRVTTEVGKVYDVHSSRVLRFIGRDLPFWEKQAEMHWGISEIEVIFDELRKRDNASWNIASLIFLANIRILQMGKLGQMLAVGSGQIQQNLFNVVQAQNWLMSNMGMMILDAEDKFDTKQYTFTGLSEVYDSFKHDIAGACEIPVTRLFGMSPAGMNATGESDLQNYYDSLEEKQEAYVRPALDKLFPIMALSLWGEVPEDFDFRFNSPRSMSNEQKADVAVKKSGVVVSAYNAGLTTQQAGMKELKQLEDETGMFSNITEKEIDKASDEVQQEGEMFGAMGGGGFGSFKNKNKPNKGKEAVIE